MDLEVDGEVYEERGFTERTTAWSVCSIWSCCDDEGRLEAVGRLGRRRRARSAAGLDQSIGSAGTRKSGEGEEQRGSSNCGQTSTEFGALGSLCWRKTAMDWRHSAASLVRWEEGKRWRSVGEEGRVARGCWGGLEVVGRGAGFTAMLPEVETTGEEDADRWVPPVSLGRRKK
jgi:hypothetical protein